jgi:hypothetical protein
MIHETSTTKSRRYWSDLWYVEVYGKIWATFKMREDARAFADRMPQYMHPYLTHGPGYLDA